MPRAVFAALAANLGIAVVKFVAFLFTGSASLLAEAVHSVADTGNEVLLIVGGAVQAAPVRRAPVRIRARAVLLRVRGRRSCCSPSGRTFSVYDGLHKILNPAPVRDAAVAFIVLAIARCWRASRCAPRIAEANRVRGDAAGWPSSAGRRRRNFPWSCWRTWPRWSAWRFAFTGVALSVITGNGGWDGAGSLAIGLLLGTAARSWPWR